MEIPSHFEDLFGANLVAEIKARGKMMHLPAGKVWLEPGDPVCS